jgi:hypothetical protein
MEVKTMNLKNERKELFYKYDVDMTTEELDQLAKVGLKEIKKDKEALVNYAVVKILEEYIMRMEGLVRGKKA